MRKRTAAAVFLCFFSAAASGEYEYDEFVGPPALTANGCPVETERYWDDNVIGGALGVEAEAVTRLREMRGLSYRTICTMSQQRLKRSLFKTQAEIPADHPEEAAKWRRMQQAGDDGTIDDAGLLRALGQRQALIAPGPKVGGVGQGNWTELGPGNIGGRIRAILTHPTDANWLMVGSVSGGLWKSIDGGASWRPINDFMPNVAIESLARDPANPLRIYAGTGEGITGSSRGLGIFYSTDGGDTWSQMPGTSPVVSGMSDFFYVERVAVHPTNSNIVVAATSGQYSNTGGVWRTMNALSATPTWTKIYDRRALDLQFDPNSPNRLLIGEGSHYYCSPTSCAVSLSDPSIGTDGGAVGVIADVTTASGSYPYSYSRVYLGTRYTGTGPSQRVELAFARATPGLVLAVMDKNDTSTTLYGQVYVSTNGGSTWSFNSNPGHLGGQGWYDNTIWVDPTDSRNVVVGGIDLYRTSTDVNGVPTNPVGWWNTNTTLTWTKISDWSIGGSYGPSAHADHHGIVQSGQYNGSTNRIVYFGNDGGFYKSPDVNKQVTNSGWVRLNNGLAITQFYSGAGVQTSGRYIIGGTQDNGSLIAPQTGTSWTTFFGGDGGYSAMDPVDVATYYGEYVYASVFRVTTGSTKTICGGLNPITEGYGNASFGCSATGTTESNFIAPFVLDPNNANTMLVGAKSLWRSALVKAVQPDWFAVKPPAGTTSRYYISAIAVAPGNSNLVWVGHNDGEVYCTTNGTAPTPTWTRVNLAPTRMVLRIMVDPSNPNRVFVTYGGFNGSNVWELTDATQVCQATPTMTDRHANLPQAPVHTIVRHPSNASWLYAGTEVGVFASIDGGVTWSTTNDGPGSVSVMELFLMGGRSLVAATWGRGMFLSDVSPGTLGFSQSALSVAESTPTIGLTVTRTSGGGGPVSVAYATANGTGVAGVNYIAASGTLAWSDSDIAPKTINVPILNDGVIAGNKTFTVTLSGPTGGATLGSSVATVTINDVGVATLPGAPIIGTASAGNALILVAFSPPASNGGAPITAYTATCTSAGKTPAVASGTASPITVTGLAIGSTYTCVVTATNSVGTGPASTASNAVIPKMAQTITFTSTPPIPASPSGSYIVSATASSGLTVTFSSASGPACTISGSTVTFGVSGLCTIDATQAGDGNYYAATSVAQAVPILTGQLTTRYRLYSGATFEHLYTTSLNEYRYLSNQIDPRCCFWSAEGPIYRVFSGPGSYGGVAAIPYYRLYNPFSYQHHWTTDANEYAVLATMGWQQEGTDGYVLPSPAPGALALYRLYLNANGGLHLWTTDSNEVRALTSTAGWQYEGVSGYVVPLP